MGQLKKQPNGSGHGSTQKKKILGIETSCDETAAGVVDHNGRLLANVVASQSELHARFGGVVPEVASRQHLLSIQGVLRRALDEAGCGWEDIDAVAVTNGPGLAGALIVGVNVAKGLAASLRAPLVGVNHLAGHVYAAWIDSGAGAAVDDNRLPTAGGGPGAPRMCLIVSGGHTELVMMDEEGRFRMIGETRDDAAGEAFDKVARVLGLGYPGGPEIQRAALDGGRTEPLPRAWLRGTDDFSFSGLKTAVIRRARREGIYPPPPEGPPPEKISALAREFQDSVVDVLVKKTVEASARFGCGEVVLAGGVAANSALRENLCRASDVPVAVPPVALCTDNGAMIAMAGLVELERGRTSGWDLDVVPGLRLAA